MKRLAGWALPILLGVAGVALIIAGSLGPGDEPGPSLPPIARPTPGPSVTPAPATPDDRTPSDPGSPSLRPSPTPEPTPTPLPDDVVAEQLEIPSVGIRVAVRQSTSAGTDAFPPSDAAYILRSSSQPGRGTNSYIFAHALTTLFKPLWNVQIGDEVLVGLSNDSVLAYTVTEVRPNVACPDPNADPHPSPPLALRVQEDCAEGSRWLEEAEHERLTLQTSQGFNRNWGELIVIAKPAP